MCLEWSTVPLYWTGCWCLCWSVVSFAAVVVWLVALEDWFSVYLLLCVFNNALAPPLSGIFCGCHPSYTCFIFLNRVYQTLSSSHSVKTVNVWLNPNFARSQSKHSPVPLLWIIHRFVFSQKLHKYSLHAFVSQLFKKDQLSKFPPPLFAPYHHWIFANSLCLLAELLCIILWSCGISPASAH